MILVEKKHHLANIVYYNGMSIENSAGRFDSFYL
jgi:hypothetical protein